MLLQPTEDQTFFRETTARFLAEHAPPDAVRRLRHDPAGFTDDFWRRGAELGWTSLLVAEAHGGGTISGDGLVDLALVAYEFGRHAAPGPLAPTNLVAAALSRTGAAHGDVLAGILAGTETAAWCASEPRPHDGVGDLALEIRVDGGDLVLHGVKRPVESAATASHLLVTGRTGEGVTQVLVPAGAPGVSITPLATVDLTRRFDAVAFDGVRVPCGAAVGEVGGAGEAFAGQLRLALAIAAAESVGAMQRAFDMTLEWAFDRYSFGRPLASYQALKHRFADMKTWLEGSHAITDAAVAATSAGAPDADILLSSAKSFVGDYGAELMQECIQLHGGIGVTFEHDLHLYFRRHAVNRGLYGTPAAHRQRLADLVQRENVA